MLGALLSIALWLAALAVTREALRALRRATVPAPPPGAGCSSLSIVVAAHDEEARIGALVESVLAQDHPDLELIVVDDRSADATSEAARRAAQGDPRLHLIRVDERPAPWQGRLYAQAVGVQQATREWLLFLSADQRLESRELLRGLLAEYERRGVAAATALGPFVGARWWETWWFRPIADNPVFVGCIFRLQEARPDATWLIGALAMRRATHREVGGAAAAASCGAGVFDDWGWTRAFERHRMRTAMVYHPGLIDVSNWETAADGWDGLTRWAAGMLASRRGAWPAALAASAGVAACAIATASVASDMAALRVPSPGAFALAAAPVTVGIAYCRAHAQRAAWALLSTPVALATLAPLWSGAVALLRNRIRWRDEELRVVTGPPDDVSGA